MQAREIDCICCREVDAMFIALAKIVFQLLWASAQLLVTRVSFIYLVDEFFFLVPGVAEQIKDAG